MKVLKQSLHDNWTFKESKGSRTWSAQVPGCVHTDLLANQVIQDPFYGNNEKRYQWIEYKDWEYAHYFSVSKEAFEQSQQTLVFEGLDTYADVYLNGELILESQNMFRTWRIPIKHLLRQDENELKVYFKSALNQALPQLAQMDFRYFAVQDDAHQASALTRKAPYHYGWDWGPRFLTAGIWKPVYLESWEVARIESLYYQTLQVEEHLAIIQVDIEIEAFQEVSSFLRIVEKDHKAIYWEDKVELHLGVHTYTYKISIENPERWWPVGLGKPHLYTLDCLLLIKEEVYDQEAQRLGIRKIELQQKEDSQGKSFEFIVNDIPLFIKGANWIPADSFPSQITDTRYRDWIQTAVDAHFNMLRVWGGGIYESDAFYDLCDELGILVWQDFMFACSLFPAHSEFLENVRQEAIDNVKRIRNHPSLALWCGDNENEWIYDFQGEGMKRRFDTHDQEIKSFEKSYYKLIEVLQRVAQEYDPQRYFWVSSPSSEGKAEPNSDDYGDIHHWDIWHMGQAVEGFKLLKPRFISEFGIQGMPHQQTLEDYIPEKEHFIGSPAMETHQKHDRGYALIQHYLNQNYPSPKDFPSYVQLSQIQQADYIKLAVEHFRALKPHCMGVLYWQFNDCWPVCSWASVDYKLRWKALHYYARKFYAPVLVYIHEEKQKIEIRIISDLLKPQEGIVRWSLMDWQGATLQQNQSFVVVPPLSSARVMSLEAPEYREQLVANKHFLNIDFFQGDQLISNNKFFFTKIKDLKLPEPKIEYALEKHQDRVHIRLRATAFAKNVTLDFPGAEGVFSDNYFDLLPQQELDIAFYSERIPDLSIFRVCSLIDYIKT